MNQITFDVAPGVHVDVPAHRLWHTNLPDERVLEFMEALAKLDKSVQHVVMS